MAPNHHPASGSGNARRSSDGQQQHREKATAAVADAANVAPLPPLTTTMHSHHLHQPAATARPGGSSAWPQKKIPPGESF